MKDPLPFDHRPDPVLGKALREALDPGDARAFTARVLALAEQVPVPSWDAVLARWARAGVAALVVALAAGYFVGRATAPSPTAVRPTVSDVLIAPPAHPAEVEVVLASVIGNN